MVSPLRGRPGAVFSLLSGGLCVAVLLAGCGGGGGGDDAATAVAPSSVATSSGAVAGSTLVVGGAAAAALAPTVEGDGSIPGPGSLRYGIDVCECSAASDATSS